MRIRLQVAFNRDELRSRVRGLPPRRITTRGHNGRAVHAVMPVDPESGGTWIAANACGLVLAVLNLNLAAEGAAPASAPRPPDGWRSRGLIIPSLIAARGVDDALACLAERVDHRQYRPFRLAILHSDATAMAVVRSTSTELSVRHEPLDRPVMLASSGLGDHLVEPPRLDLFRTWFEGLPDLAGVTADGSSGSDAEVVRHWLNRQTALHEHAWPDARQRSVLMSRRDARTVSSTVVCVTTAGTTMRHFDYTEAWPAGASGEGGSIDPAADWSAGAFRASEPVVVELPAPMTKSPLRGGGGNGHSSSDFNGMAGHG